ncbi:hypothetical protein M427DRAFT_44830 [Gonapodya prolifera JEL478]|uniref:Uncharacterized protein n=1 Tax=Gonapodya prolifera (strain JEL478) TaxID=1344416 RepID=A0A139ADG3_GONPJ|nr:hypothetical protein M427DRAFT_44830 [Gonapodya prolifera JEL478]|eukprot:KXS14866.1 hypothetical protein M427DRAFT_44830 [Gonapodya prolifera JEL478]
MAARSTKKLGSMEKALLEETRQLPMETTLVVVQALLNMGVSLNTLAKLEPEQNATPLCEVCHPGNLALVMVLLDRGGDLNLDLYNPIDFNLDSVTADSIVPSCPPAEGLLFLAVINGFADIASLLLDCGAEHHYWAYNTIEHNQGAALKLLVEHNMNSNNPKLSHVKSILLDAA